MRPIDADELLEHAYRDRLDSRERIADMIRNAPTIEERKTGRWEKCDDDFETWWYECSECGCYPPRNTFGQEELSEYCPQCGAKMEG